MLHIGWPTATVVPSATRCSPIEPSAGAGISAFTLSVTTSAMDSYLATNSPGCLSHLAIVPSVTDSPNWGMLTVKAMAEMYSWGNGQTCPLCRLSAELGGGRAEFAYLQPPAGD